MIPESTVIAAIRNIIQSYTPAGMANENQQQENHSFKQKVWIIIGYVTLTVLLLLFFSTTFNVFLLILAGVLIALYFHGLSGLLHRKLNLSEKITLPVAIIGSLALLVLFFWFAGDRIQQQAKELSDTLPAAFEHFKAQVQQNPIGIQVMERISSGDSSKKLESVARSFFRTTFGVLGDLYVVLFLGLFYTVSPFIYTKGIISLVPANAKSKGRDVMGKLGSTLTKWLKGKIISMFVVAVLTAIGLVILRIPLWLVLALLAGLLSFVPNFGPLLALIPAVLIGLLQGTTTALLVLGLYLLVQALESNLITPQIQKKLINIPPALIITAQLFMGVLTGGWGLILATPIVAIVMVLVQELYIKKQ